MAIIYSKLNGRPVEVSDLIAAELAEFEASDRGQVLMNHSTAPLPPGETRVGMLRLGAQFDEMRHAEAKEASQKAAEEERRKLEPPPLDPSPGADWRGFVE